MTDRSTATEDVPAPDPDDLGHDVGSGTVAAGRPGDPALEAVRGLCPYLLADGGAWRSVSVAREHRCAAVEPPAPVAPEKQRRLCLVSAHEGCATFRAAQQDLVDAVAEPAGPGDRRADAERTAIRWAVPSTTPVVLERGRPGLSRLRVDRSMAQVALAILMIAAFAVLALARLSADEPSATPPTSPRPSAVASPSPSASPSPAASPSAAPSPSPSP
jgi:hypothetical protein